jgi:hypothetical protein
MRRLFHALLLAALLAGPARAEEPVHFADEKLKAAVEETLWISDPTPSDMLGLVCLDADDQDIADLTGLEYATDLVELRLTFNRITDISVLSGLSNLHTLVLNNNHISDISPVSGLTNLEMLDVHNNELSDISPVSGLTNLRTLYLRINHISDISPLASLTNLEELVIRTNEISDISPLAGLTRLQSLALSENQISDISVLAGLPDLEELMLNANGIQDISPLAGLTCLDFLSLGSNPLNADAYDIYIPQIETDNPGISILYDPRTMHRVMISSTTGGSVLCPGEGEFTCGEGRGITLEAVADPGFVFASWSGNCSTGQNPAYIVVTRDIEIRANFLCQRDTIHVADNTAADSGSGDLGAVGDPGGNGTIEHPLGRIQDAIDVALDGATIFVHEGTYHETIDLLGKRIKVTGLDPNDPNRMTWPVLDGDGTGPVVSLAHSEPAGCELYGFVITGGRRQTAAAIFCAGGSPTIANCLIVGNHATDPTGAALYCVDSNATFINCTITDNHGGSQGAGLSLLNSSVAVSNSILWGNTPCEILSTGTAQPVFRYSDVADEFSGPDDIAADPLFARRGCWVDRNHPDIAVQPDYYDALWIMGDYHLQSEGGRWDTETGDWVEDHVTSPGIDAGDPAVPVAVEPAPNGGIVNMGAYGDTAEASKSRTLSP